jgi:DNA-binding transcriptional ArsR family regulator
MDLTRGRSQVGVDVVASPSIEFLMTLTRFGMEESRETFEDGAWFDEVRTKASPELLEAFRAVSGQKGSGWGCLVGIPLGLAPQWEGNESISQFIDHVDAIPPRELWLIMAGYHIRPLRDEIGPDAYLRAAEGDTGARKSILEVDRKFSDDLDEQPPILSMTPEETKKGILTVLRLWYRDIFAGGEGEVSRILERDATAKRSLAASTTPEKLIEIATNGIEFRGERWIRRVVLVPHVVMRPWNVSCAWEERSIICYPVADESLGSDDGAPSPRMVRLYKALGDEKRLRILKRLTEGQATLQELADEVGLAKSSAHHHMVILRSAGLVTVTDDLQRLYTLRTGTIPEASGLLQRFLEGARS